MTIKSDRHMTATEKKAVKAMVSKGWDYARTRTKAYRLSKLSDNSYQVLIASKSTLFIGEKPKWREDTHYISIQ